MFTKGLNLPDNLFLVLHLLKIAENLSPSKYVVKKKNSKKPYNETGVFLFLFLKDNLEM